MTEHRRYRPSNGCEGMDFIERTCTYCRHNDPEDIDGCPIQAASMAFHIDHPAYPKEWIYGDDGVATCTAFIDRESGEPIQLRCENTIDLFNPN